MEPLTEIAAEKLAKLFIMYEINQYHIRDITDATLAAAKDAKWVFVDNILLLPIVCVG